jgi:hypothetical protein
MGKCFMVCESYLNKAIRISRESPVPQIHNSSLGEFIALELKVNHKQSVPLALLFGQHPHHEFALTIIWLSS